MPKTMREQLLDLHDAVAAGDADAIKQATDLRARIEQADQANDLLKFMGDGAKSAAADKPARTLGEFAAKNLDLSAMRAGMSRSAGTDFGYKTATDPHGTVTVESIDQRAVDVVSAQALPIRGLFGSETISGNALKYYVLGATEGAPATTAENAQKPQFHVPYTPKTVALAKIAGWFYETDELLEDAPFLVSAINNRGLFALNQAIESTLVTGLLGTSGIGTIAQAPTADNIFQAIMQVKSASNLDADAILINPTDYQTLRLAKDGGTSGQYYGGGYFYGPYGNGQVAQQPGLWGLNTVITTAVTAGTVVVGAFRQGGSVVTKAGEGARVEVVTGDHDDRTNNRVTVIVEERLALAVRVPGAFVKIEQ